MTCECFNQMMDFLRTNLPGALDNAIEQEISNLLTGFFQKTNAWIEKVPFRVRAGKKEYDVAPGDGVAIRLIRATTGSDTPIAATMPSLGTLLLRDDPNETATYLAYIATKQKQGEGLDRIPDWVYESYQLVLQHGVIGRMMTQPAKPYSNERLAIYNMRQYMKLSSQVKAEVAQQNLWGGQPWRYPRNFARGSQR